MARIDEMLRSVRLHALAKSDQQEKLDNSENQIIPIDPSYAPIIPTRSLMGARGRDPSGYPKVIPAGMPPAQFGEFHREGVPKALEIPPRPPNSAELIAISVTANTGDIIEKELGFPVRTIMIDNYSHIWVYIDGLQRWVAPITMGWCFPVYRAQTKVRLVASCPTGHTQTAVTAGDIVNVIATEERFAYAAGVAVPTG